MSNAELFTEINNLNIRHYPVDSIIRLLKKIESSPNMGTIACDHFIGYGTHLLTLKLLKRLQSIGWLEGKKDALNQYRWKLTELGKQKILP